MTTPIRFLLLMPWGRVGSNLLFSILKQSLPMKTDNERFNQLRTAAEQDAWCRNFYEIDRGTVLHTHIGSKQNVLAVKDLPALRRLLSANRVRIVRLRRDNIVKSAVSQMRAEQFADGTREKCGVARWAVRHGEEKLGTTRLDLDMLLRRIELIESLQQRLMSGFESATVADVEYEELNTALPQTVRRIRKFLELPDKPLRVPFVKATPDALEEAVENFSEMSQRLSGTRWAAQVNEKLRCLSP